MIGDPTEHRFDVAITRQVALSDVANEHVRVALVQWQFLGPLGFAVGTFLINFGSSNTASGSISTAFGLGNTAHSAREMVIGSYATNYVPVSVAGAVTTN